ncbi:hypothetical protein P5673_006789 [Acropora cervicornis]|uniref:Uncharacterized protein n=1 Tax=Acropora cervicornis TaxID=6130 RepID=A0AAD9VBU2_ACRCE|nr:hypothetical protein P5673_006789 [Acropora cervicornis]
MGCCCSNEGNGDNWKVSKGQYGGKSRREEQKGSSEGYGGSYGGYDGGDEGCLGCIFGGGDDSYEGYGGESCGGDGGDDCGGDGGGGGD